MAPNYDNPLEMKGILMEIAGLLSRFSKENHRHVKGKNVIPGTGCYVKQNRANPKEYVIVFFTPDDIGVQARIDMELLYEDPPEKIEELVIGVCQYITTVRERKNPLAAPLLPGVIH